MKTKLELNVVFPSDGKPVEPRTCASYLVENKHMPKDYYAVLVLANEVAYFKDGNITYSSLSSFKQYYTIIRPLTKDESVKFHGTA